MAKKNTTESAPTTLDRLVDLRRNLSHHFDVGELLDVLIDQNGGDSVALAGEIAEQEANANSDANVDINASDAAEEGED